MLDTIHRDPNPRSRFAPTLDSCLRRNDGGKRGNDGGKWRNDGGKWRNDWKERGDDRDGGGLGFTLIELLIVIAIILILIAIALPNFLEAQMRAKYARAQGELRSLMLAIESYQVDHNGQYPVDCSESTSRFSPFPSGRDLDGMDFFSFMAVTTPVVYIKEVPQDYFQESRSIPNQVAVHGVPYLTYNYHETVSLQRNFANGIGPNNIGAILENFGIRWVVFGIGPDQVWQIETMSHPDAINSVLTSKAGGSAYSYSPTNGTKSLGDIIRSNAAQN
jgi:prepilin-type N-terminal cleavage/methylation domain-containing protein